MAYTRVNWEDLPSTNTPRNATNLNKMDKGIYDHDNMLRYGIKGSQQSYSSINDFKSALITSTYLTGSYIVDLNINGSIYIAIVQKASNSYLSFIIYNYNGKIHEYNYYNGTWSDFEYLTEDKNYYSNNILNSSLFEPNANHQAITRTGDIVTINIALYTKDSFSAGAYNDVLTIPQEIRPPANQLGTAFCTSSNIVGFWYYQSSSGYIRVKFVSAIPSGAEICLSGTYSLI